MEQLNFIYQENDFLRIDKFLSNEIKEFTRSQIQMMIEEGLVLVNDKVIKSNYKLKINDEILKTTYYEIGLLNDVGKYKYSMHIHKFLNNKFYFF